jgi:hypothetical protein
MTVSATQEKDKVERIKLSFQNPLTNDVDSVLIRKRDLEYLRKKESSGIVIVSFFHSMRDQSYIINLHVDRENNVRACHQSTLFLKTNKKLFPTYGE